jgi:hypothetical protein
MQSSSIQRISLYFAYNGESWAQRNSGNNLDEENPVDTVEKLKNADRDEGSARDEPLNPTDSGKEPVVGNLCKNNGDPFNPVAQDTSNATYDGTSDKITFSADSDHQAINKEHLGSGAKGREGGNGGIEGNESNEEEGGGTESGESDEEDDGTTESDDDDKEEEEDGGTESEEEDDDTESEESAYGKVTICFLVFAHLRFPFS